MIDRTAIEAIIAQYRKHGWSPRRVLLSARLKEGLQDDGAIFSGMDVRSSELDAIWFTRSSRPGTTAWEVRRLADPPFALVIVLTDDAEPKESEAALAEAESRISEFAGKYSTGH